MDYVKQRLLFQAFVLLMLIILIGVLIPQPIAWVLELFYHGGIEYQQVRYSFKPGQGGYSIAFYNQGNTIPAFLVFLLPFLVYGIPLLGIGALSYRVRKGSRFISFYSTSAINLRYVILAILSSSVSFSVIALLMYFEIIYLNDLTVSSVVSSLMFLMFLPFLNSIYRIFRPLTSSEKALFDLGFFDIEGGSKPKPYLSFEERELVIQSLKGVTEENHGFLKKQIGSDWKKIAQGLEEREIIEIDGGTMRATSLGKFLVKNNSNRTLMFYYI